MDVFNLMKIRCPVLLIQVYQGFMGDAQWIGFDQTAAGDKLLGITQLGTLYAITNPAGLAK